MPRELKAPLRAPEIQRNVSWRREQGTVTFSLEMTRPQTSHGHLETPVGSPQRCPETTGLSLLQKALCSSWRRNKHGVLTGMCLVYGDPELESACWGSPWQLPEQQECRSLQEKDHFPSGTVSLPTKPTPSVEEEAPPNPIFVLKPSRPHTRRAVDNRVLHSAMSLSTITLGMIQSDFGKQKRRDMHLRSPGVESSIHTSSHPGLVTAPVTLQTHPALRFCFLCLERSCPDLHLAWALAQTFTCAWASCSPLPWRSLSRLPPTPCSILFSLTALSAPGSVFVVLAWQDIYCLIRAGDLGKEDDCAHIFFSKCHLKITNTQKGINMETIHDIRLIKQVMK